MRLICSIQEGLFRNWPHDRNKSELHLLFRGDSRPLTPGTTLNLHRLRSRYAAEFNFGANEGIDLIREAEFWISTGLSAKIGARSPFAYIPAINSIVFAKAWKLFSKASRLSFIVLRIIPTCSICWSVNANTGVLCF